MSYMQRLKAFFRRKFKPTIKGIGQKMSGHRIINSISDLDEILAELDIAVTVSDEELRRMFTTFSMKYPFKVPKTLTQMSTMKHNLIFMNASQLRPILQITNHQISM